MTRGAVEMRAAAQFIEESRSAEMPRGRVVSVSEPAVWSPHSRTVRVRVDEVDRVCQVCRTWESACFCHTPPDLMRDVLRRIAELHAVCHPRDCPERQRLAAAAQQSPASTPSIRDGHR